MICPDVVKLVITVPAGAVAGPVAFEEGRRQAMSSRRSVVRPRGDEPARRGLRPDHHELSQPRAAVGRGRSRGRRGAAQYRFVDAVGSRRRVLQARQTTFDALNDTIPSSLTSLNPLGLVQVVAVEAIEVVSSGAFEAFEEGLLGVVQTVDVAADDVRRHRQSRCGG